MKIKYNNGYIAALDLMVINSLLFDDFVHVYFSVLSLKLHQVQTLV